MRLSDLVQELVTIFAGFDSTILTDDRELLMKNAASIRLGGKDFFTGKPLAKFYTVAIYPRVATYFLEVTGVTFEDLWNDYATKCGCNHRFKATTFFGSVWQGAERMTSYLITDRETRIGERVTGFTCRKPGHTVAVTIQPKGDGKTILCTLVVVMDE